MAPLSSSLPEASSSCPLDLQADAVRLCIALQTQLNPAFLSAATDLLSCSDLPPDEFRRHSRKIIRLIEAARATLEASGTSLFLFTLSEEANRKYKDAYFDLLHMLQKRRADVDATLQSRANSLLVRLSSNFCSGPDSTFQFHGVLPDALRQSLALGITTCTPVPVPQPARSSNDMPPPDAFPHTRRWSEPPRHQRKRARYHLLLPNTEAHVRRARKRVRHEAEQENHVPGPCPDSEMSYNFKPPKLTKRFGIFCTGKSSMHQPRSVRAY
ncbi:hypothetical protein FB45DRAFT_948159 [Roridomyces roridus]|uniref:Uncharacterized protein n=1 Tax=Roridomyces roridus TaxID=1738132 RepID=A0AAD7B1K6_9AGAR|nr:hypothetical protein FB45DRAFT_948159 [Roridomyces roridus]